ncbi:DUF998 domain-containing protein [Gordonia sp. PDNC005]|uniref:DUF998 domain-containing protein n=1 Tax=unclassified Gordonia (in: high G+C Gram-positive bacteria) TaxID=2657482 RepID=UPI0019646C94|nr:DUF998 domain-containing protein [Gordonia sp. PDNC005]QRY62061.1 DUF998 domain-containing protein [Gordonia sp. PDNC005]
MSSGKVWSVLATAALVIAGIAYSSWVFDFIVPTGRDRFRSFLSELEADDVPWHQVYSYGDIVTGVAAIGASLLLFGIRPRGRGAATAVVALGVFGMATVADALAPMGTVPIVHAATSAIAVFSLFVTMGAATWSSFHEGNWPIMRTLGATTFALVTIATGWMLGSDRLQGDYLLGLAQRIQVGAMSVWLLVFSVGTWSSRRRVQRPKRAPRTP